MVIKSLSRKSGTRQLFQYLLKNEKKIVGKFQKPIIIRHNVRSRTNLDKWIKEYQQNNSLRIHKRKDQVLVYHDILSFSNKDKDQINEKIIRDIAKQYIKERGEMNQFIAVLHQDKNHYHIHFAVSGTKYLTGEANRLSRAEFHQLKLSMDSYQLKKYPQLINSLPRHGRSKETAKDKSLVINRAGGRISQKETLMKTLESTYSKAKSLDDFLSKLRSQGHEPYYRGKDNRLTGIKFEGGDRKFRFSTCGYKEKIAQLEALKIKEEKTLSELRDLRESRSSGREQNDSRESLNSEKDPEEKDEGIERFRDDDIDRDDHAEEDNEPTIDDDDNLE